MSSRKIQALAGLTSIAGACIFALPAVAVPLISGQLAVQATSGAQWTIQGKEGYLDAFAVHGQLLGFDPLSPGYGTSSSRMDNEGRPPQALGGSTDPNINNAGLNAGLAMSGEMPGGMVDNTWVEDPYSAPPVGLPGDTVALSGLAALDDGVRSPGNPGSAISPHVDMSMNDGRDFLSVGDSGRNLTQIPEPGTLALFGLGLAGMSLLRRKRDPQGAASQS